jgi:hypothetical protein
MAMPDTPSPRHAPPPRPYTSLDTYIVLDRALVELADRRFMPTLDAPTQLHLLASIVAQAEHWLGEQVAIARKDGASWGEVGHLLGSTATAARQRWAPPAHTATRRPPPAPSPSGARP